MRSVGLDMMWSQEFAQELRQRMARALVVIEALRKRLREVESGGHVLHTVDESDRLESSFMEST